MKSVSCVSLAPWARLIKVNHEKEKVDLTLFNFSAGYQPDALVCLANCNTVWALRWFLFSLFRRLFPMFVRARKKSEMRRSQLWQFWELCIIFKLAWIVLEGCETKHMDLWNWPKLSASEKSIDCCEWRSPLFGNVSVLKCSLVVLLQELILRSPVYIFLK